MNEERTEAGWLHPSHHSAISSNKEHSDRVPSPFTYITRWHPRISARHLPSLLLSSFALLLDEPPSRQKWTPSPSASHPHPTTPSTSVKSTLRDPRVTVSCSMIRSFLATFLSVLVPCSPPLLHPSRQARDLRQAEAHWTSILLSRCIRWCRLDRPCQQVGVID